VSTPDSPTATDERTGASAWSRQTAWGWGAARLAGADLDPGDARLEAEILLRHAVGLSREELLARPRLALPHAAASAYAASIEKRAAGTPSAYLIGRREFFGVDMVVDERVMIPRPETERLVEVLADILRDRRAPLVVDVGTGSGAIAIALARLMPQARLLATDVSPAALEVARLNAARTGVVDRIAWGEGPNLDPLAGRGLEGTLDALVANPPYIPTAEVARLPREVRDHEPPVALDGGPDGLAVHRVLIEGAGAYLSHGGILALEVAALWDQARAVVGLIAATGTFGPARVVRDYAGAERVVIAATNVDDGSHRR